MTKETKLQRLIKLMRRGWVSPSIAVAKLNLYSLSQRCGQLRRNGVNVADKWVKDKNGRNVCKAYRIVSGKGC